MTGLNRNCMALLAAIVLAPSMVCAQTLSTIRIGVLNDLNGPSADASGRGSVIAAKMAADDFRNEVGTGAPRVEILVADHQNKADIGAAIARQWVDRDGVAAVVDVPNSAVALAVNQIMRERDRAFLASSTATSDLTGSQCAPTTVQWTFDTWSIAHATVKAVMGEGGANWFFIASDFALGTALTRDAGEAILAGGGRVLGDVRVPLGAPDYSSVLLQAKSSGANVIAIATGAGDTGNVVKQAAEFGIDRGGRTRIAGLMVFLSDVKGLGLDAAQGLLLTEGFYWDLNESTRSWSRRFAALSGGRMPTMNHAGVYSETLAYLRAATAVNSISGRVVVMKMAAGPIDDPLFGPTTIRPDGRAIHAMYLFRVKRPQDSKGPYDLYDLVATIPADQAFRPMQEGGCMLVSGVSTPVKTP